MAEKIGVHTFDLSSNIDKYMIEIMRSTVLLDDNMRVNYLGSVKYYKDSFVVAFNEYLENKLDNLIDTYKKYSKFYKFLGHVELFVEEE